MQETRFSTDLKEMAAFLELMEHKISARIQKHGTGLHISAYETVGLIEEELLELKQAIHDGNELQTIRELEDVLISCLFGVVSTHKRMGKPGDTNTH